MLQYPKLLSLSFRYKQWEDKQFMSLKLEILMIVSLVSWIKRQSSEGSLEASSGSAVLLLRVNHVIFPCFNWKI